MRSTLLLLALGIVLSSCNMNIQMADAPFTLDSLMMYDYQGLEKLFGAEKLKDSLGKNFDGQPIRYTLVMPGTKAAVRLQWVDTTRASIDYATIMGTASSWKTRDSVTLGMPMVELEKINGAPFYFYNDGPNVKELAYHELKEPTNPGYVWLWITEGGEKSRLAGRLHAVKLNASIKFPQDGNQLDNILSSSNPKAIENNPMVIEVSISRLNIPLKLWIEDIVFARTANIPHAVSNRPDDRVDKINSVILEYFDLKSFESDQAEDFSWSSLSFETEMDENIIAIHIRGSYLGPYPSEIDDVLFISKSGYKMDAVDIPFYTLFKHDSYFNFLDKYWNGKCEVAMQKAAECAGGLPSCSCLDMSVSAANDNLVIATSGDCFPHAAQACNPKATAQISLKDLAPYLSDFGKKVVVEQGYYSKTALEQLNIANEYRYGLPNVMFIRFDIVNAQDDSQADQAVIGLQLIPNDDPFSGKIEGWVKYLNQEGEPFKVTGSYDEYGAFTLQDTENIYEEFVFKWMAPGEDPLSAETEYYLEGGMDGFRFEIIKTMYSGFRFYEPRGD
jgi:hypothetical protein